jgi:hypothetical protein
MAITVASAAAYLNRLQETRAPQIATQMRQGLVTENELSPRVADRVYTVTNASIADLVQAYQCDFTPNNAETFHEEAIPLQALKIDLQYTCDDMDKFFDTFYVQWTERGSGKKPEDHMFPMWIYENLVIPKVKEELELSIAYKGIRVTPTSGTAGTVAGSCDGLGKKIADAITASRITPITTGAVTTSNVLDQLAAFNEALPVIHRDRSGKIYMSPTLARALAGLLLEKYKTNCNIDPMGDIMKLRIPNTNKTVIGLPSMEGRQRIIFSAQADNLVVVRRRGESIMPVIRWESYERKLKGFAEFHRGYGFEFGGNLYVNDVA